MRSRSIRKVGILKKKLMTYKTKASRGGKGLKGDGGCHLEERLTSGRDEQIGEGRRPSNGRDRRVSLVQEIANDYKGATRENPNSK